RRVRAAGELRSTPPDQQPLRLLGPLEHDRNLRFPGLLLLQPLGPTCRQPLPELTGPVPGRRPVARNVSLLDTLGTDARRGLLRVHRLEAVARAGGPVALAYRLGHDLRFHVLLCGAAKPGRKVPDTESAVIRSDCCRAR